QSLSHHLASIVVAAALHFLAHVAREAIRNRHVHLVHCAPLLHLRVLKPSRKMLRCQSLIYGSPRDGKAGGPPKLRQVSNLSRNQIWVPRSSPILARAGQLAECGRETTVLTFDQLIMKHLKLVEAAGVEPASENVVSKEPTYLVTFMRRSYPALSPVALRTDKKRSRPT